MIDVYITTGFDDKVVTSIPHYQLEECLKDRDWETWHRTRSYSV